MQVKLPDAVADEVRELSKRTGIPEAKLLEMISETAFENLPPLADMAAAWVRGDPIVSIQIRPSEPVVPLPPEERAKIPEPKIPSRRPRAPSMKIGDHI